MTSCDLYWYFYHPAFTSTFLLSLFFFTSNALITCMHIHVTRQQLFLPFEPWTSFNELACTDTDDQLFNLLFFVHDLHPSLLASIRLFGFLFLHCSFDLFAQIQTAPGLFFFSWTWNFAGVMPSYPLEMLVTPYIISFVLSRERRHIEAGNSFYSLSLEIITHGLAALNVKLFLTF